MQSGLAFIVGAEASGKHWLWRCLSTHPEVLGIPETHAFLFGHRPEPSALAQVREISLWKLVREHAGNHVSESTPPGADELCSAEDAFLRRVDRPRIQELAALLHELPNFASWEDVFAHLTATLDGTRPMLVEKSPGHVFYISRIHARFPESRFVGVVRDGRSVYASTLRERRLWRLEPVDARAVAMRWLRSTSTLIRAQSQFPSQVLLVRHEDLVANPVAKVTEVCSFLCVPAVPQAIQSLVNFSTFAAGTEHPRPDESAGVDLSDTVDYRELLSEREIAQFESLAAPMLERLEYATDDSLPQPA